MTATNNFIRGLIKGVVIVIMILSLPVKLFNYIVYESGKEEENLEHKH